MKKRKKQNKFKKGSKKVVNNYYVSIKPDCTNVTESPATTSEDIDNKLSSEKLTGRYNFSSRSVIVPDPDLRIDEIKNDDIRKPLTYMDFISNSDDIFKDLISVNKFGINFEVGCLRDLLKKLDILLSQKEKNDNKNNTKATEWYDTRIIDDGCMYRIREVLKEIDKQIGRIEEIIK